MCVCMYLAIIYIYLSIISHLSSSSSSIIYLYIDIDKQICLFTYFCHYSIFILVFSFIYSYTTYLLSTYCLQRISHVIPWDKENEKIFTLEDGADANKSHNLYCSTKRNVVNSVLECQICQRWRFRNKGLLVTDGIKEGRFHIKVKFGAPPEKTNR